MNLYFINIEHENFITIMKTKVFVMKNKIHGKLNISGHKYSGIDWDFAYEL